MTHFLSNVPTLTLRDARYLVAMERKTEVTPEYLETVCQSR